MSFRKKVLKQQLKNLLSVGQNGEPAGYLQSDSTYRERLHQALYKCSNFRQFSGLSHGFARQVAQVRTWQEARIRKTYHALLLDPQLQLAAQFVLEEAYTAVDYVGLIDEVERMIPYALKLFPAPLLETVCLVLELNAVTAELDEKLAWAIFQDIKATEVDEVNYLQAFAKVNGCQLRSKQLKIIDKLGIGIDQYLQSQWLCIAFKLAKMPAKAAGLGTLVDLIGKGFIAINALDMPASVFIGAIVQQEIEINDNIHAGMHNPFQCSDMVALAS